MTTSIFINLTNRDDHRFSMVVSVMLTIMLSELLSILCGVP